MRRYFRNKREAKSWCRNNGGDPSRLTQVTVWIRYEGHQLFWSYPE